MVNYKEHTGAINYNLLTDIIPALKLSSKKEENYDLMAVLLIIILINSSCAIPDYVNNVKYEGLCDKWRGFLTYLGNTLTVPLRN
jgi:hypothetical protein